MRVVVVGATGNVGRSLLDELATEPSIDEVVGVARRRPTIELPKVVWRTADVAADDLDPLVAGADAVVHLAWAIQPIRDRSYLHRINVDGTARLVDALLRQRVPALIYASSVGTYAPGPKDRRVDESWPATGVPTSVYSSQKAMVEAHLDAVEREHPELRIVRMRTALVFQQRAAVEVGRYFLGRLAPMRAIGRRWTPFVPANEQLVFQAVHASDCARACRLALTSDVAGAFNIAAEPVLTDRELAHVFAAHRLALPKGIIRGGAALSHALRLQPTEPGWVDLALAAPVMGTTAAREQLGWTAGHGAVEAVAELLDGFAARSAGDTPPLAADGHGYYVPEPHDSRRSQEERT